MPLVVQKFGGSSVANKDGIMNAAHRAILARRAGSQVIVVVSARGDTTDELINLAKEVNDEPPAREMDMLLSTGEQVSCALLAMAIHKQGEQAISFTGNQVGIQTDSIHGKARIRKIDTKRLREALDSGHIVIVAGFQGIDQSGNITTLGRGGSDTTAVALAAVMKHDPAGPREVSCDIYTDVEGIFTTDPRLIRAARKLDMVSYDEMLELASVGANVLASRSIEFARKFAVPMQKRSSFSENEGTWIVPEADWMKAIDVCGAAMAKDEARVAVIDVPNTPGVSHKIFSAIAEKNIAVDMIVQNNALSGQKATIGFTVLGAELRATLKAVEPVVAELHARVEFEENVSKVSIVGTGMREHTGVAQRMFEALADANINMKMITTGDIKISVLVDRKDGPPALAAVHQKFRLHEPRPGSGLPIGAANRPLTGLGSPGAHPNDDAELYRQLLSSMEEIVVSSVTLNYEHGLVYVFNLPAQPTNCARIFRAVADAGIIVDMIVQNPSDKDRAQISFSVPVNDLQRALLVTRKEAIAIDPAAAAEAGPHVARLIVSGVGMRSHTGVAKKMFHALAAAGINIAMINTSEVSINVVVDRAKGQEAHDALKSAFSL